MHGYLVNAFHPVLIHFPIALLIVSVVLDFVARRKPFLRGSAWLALVLGTVGTIPASISGLIAHLPYEDSPLLASIEQHQYLAFVTTAIFIALTLWRWRSLRRNVDVGGTGLYAVLAVVGLVVLVITSTLGGSLVYTQGIGVQGVTR